MKVVIYTRVSTNIQDCERQISELEQYAKVMRYDVVEVFKETISGAYKNEDRPIFSEMVKFIADHKIDKVLCWELSRLGRNTIEVLKTIQLFNDSKVSLYIKNYNIETLKEDKTVDLLGSFMIQILSSVYEMERNQIKERMVSGYNHYRSKGGKVGRKQGWNKNDNEILNEYKDVVKKLKQGLSVREIMKLTGRSNGTIMKVKKILAEQAV